ncbi:MAG: trigger factor [Meiothermus sp.]|nr:trigger factor [Meiothermus sp.]
MAQILEREGYKVKIQVEVPAEQVERAYQSVLSEYASNVKLPGFRPGKVPAKVVESKIGREALMDEVKKELRDKTFPKAAQELELLPVGANVLEESLVFGQPFVYTVAVENYPEVKLGEWKAVELSAEAPPVTDETVAAALEELRARNGEMVVVEREVSERDSVFIETDDGGRFPVNMENAQAHVREVLLGKRAGDEVLVPVKDGETVIREIKTRVIEVKGLQLPELDDEFAKTVGEDSLEALTAKVRQSLTDQFEREGRNARASQFLDKLGEIVEAEIPPSMQSREEQSLLEQLNRDLEQQKLDFNTYIKSLEQEGKLEEFTGELKESATKRLRRSLAVEALSEELKVELSDQEFEAFLEDLARSYRTTAPRLKNELGAEAVARLRVQRLHDKALFTALDMLGK